jgi:hypothetical protein
VPRIFFDLSGPGLPTVTEFSVYPEAPAEYEPYFAWATICCARDTTTASITIQGTDGYTDTNFCSAAHPGVFFCSLDVPGAEQGVVDTLSLMVNDPSVAQISEVTDLFFR